MYTVFIQSYNSPEKCSTLNVLKKYNFNSNYYIVIGNDDPKINRYKEIYNDDVLLIFNKEKYKLNTETITSNKKDCSAVYVKNFIEDFVINNNIDNFLIIDDDLEQFRYKIPDTGGHIRSREIDNVDEIFEMCFEYMNNAHIDGMCFGAQYVYMGGLNSYYGFKKRVITNMYLRTTEHKIDWKSLVFDDFNTSLDISNKGYVFLMLPPVGMVFAPQYFQLINKETSQSKGCGLQQLYDDTDSFERAFYSTIICPSAVRPSKIKKVYMPYIKVDNVFPKIISCKFKKS